MASIGFFGPLPDRSKKNRIFGAVPRVKMLHVCMGKKKGIFHRLPSENYIFSPAANDQCLFLRGFLPLVLFLYLAHTFNLYFARICCLSFSLPVPLFMFPPK